MTEVIPQIFKTEIKQTHYWGGGEVEASYQTFLKKQLVGGGRRG